ncbi:MAG: hypothetical protein Fues2KO_20930 [Fuerstiella sp.]
MMAIRVASICSLFAVALLAGCEEPSAPAPPVLTDGHGHDHDHGHDHPETFSAAFAAVEHLNADIAKGFANDDAEAAHGPLHEIADVLPHLSEMAEDLHLEDEHKKEVLAAVATLKDSFKAVDKKLHDQDGGKDYSEVKDQIDQAIATIEEKAAEHLHEDHDNDGDHNHAEHGDHDHHDEADHKNEGHDDAEKPEAVEQ